MNILATIVYATLALSFGTLAGLCILTLYTFQFAEEHLSSKRVL